MLSLFIDCLFRALFFSFFLSSWPFDESYRRIFIFLIPFIYVIYFVGHLKCCGSEDARKAPTFAIVKGIYSFVILKASCLIKILGANQQLVDRINYFASNIENNTRQFSDFDKDLNMINQAIFNDGNDGRKTNYMILREKEKLLIIPMNPVKIDQESYKQEIIEKEEELFTWDTKKDNLLEEPIKVK